MIADQQIGTNFMKALGYNLRKLNLVDLLRRPQLLENNFTSPELSHIKKEVDLIRQLRPKLSKYVYHTSLNFSKEEIDSLDKQTLLAIAHDYLQGMGFTNNQYFIFRHHDADHPHIHLLVNRICFDGSVVSDSNNFKRSEAILRRLEYKYNLIPVEQSSYKFIGQGNGIAIKRHSYKGDCAPKKDELEMVLRTGKPSDKMVLQEKLKKLLNLNLSLQEFIKEAERQGIHLLFNQASTGRVSGITYFYNNFKAKGQALGNRFRWGEITKHNYWTAKQLAKQTAERSQNTEKSDCQQIPAKQNSATELLATGNWYIDQVWREARSKGLSCGRKNFWQIIRNPVFCGRIFIPKYKDEEAHTVPGLHEAIVSEDLFNRVLDVLDGRKKSIKSKISSPIELPLRGYLICPKCGYMLTGSASKGCTRRYHYYHCFAKCGVRFNANLVNREFENELRKYAINPAMLDLYKQILTDVFEQTIGGRDNELSVCRKQLNGFAEKIDRARELLLIGDLDSADYRKIKNDSERQISILEGKLLELSQNTFRIGPLLQKALLNAAHLPELYENADIQEKRKIISSMFPENLTFDGSQHRTTRINDAIRVFNALKADFGEKKRANQY